MCRVHVVILERNTAAKYKIESTKNTITFSRVMVLLIYKKSGDNAKPGHANCYDYDL
jgi:hypothetical protein